MSWLRIRLRAIRFSQARRRLNDREHIAWAHNLVGKPKALQHDNKPYRIICERKPE